MAGVPMTPDAMMSALDRFEPGQQRVLTGTYRAWMAVIYDGTEVIPLNVGEIVTVIAVRRLPTNTKLIGHETINVMLLTSRGTLGWMRRTETMSRLLRLL